MHSWRGAAAFVALAAIGCASSGGDSAATYQRFTSCAFGDFDRDGDEDLFLGQFAGSEALFDVLSETDQLFLNDGGGRFSLAEDRLPPRSGGSTFGIVSAFAADFNLDGYLDLILSRVAPDQLSGAGLQLLVNDGAGRFVDGSDAIVETFDEEQWLPWAHAADIDADGRPDVVISAGFGERSLILHNTPEGTFEAHREHLDLIGVDYGQMAHGDVDGDGLVDLVALVGDTVQSRIQVLLNRSTAPGSFQWQALPAMFVPIQGLSGALLDWDDDGDLDLVGTRFQWPPATSEDGVSLFENDGHGSFSEAPPAMLVGAPVPTEHPRVFSVADFNGDGRSDLLIGDHGLDQPPFAGFQNQLLVQQAQGGVADESLARLGERNGFTHCACAADVDNDGDVDLLTCDLNVNQESGVVLSVNDGSGQFDNVLIDVPKK
ncbi:MAG: VCBS repeat-containing protein [Myxococcota bacterium]